tara:strand:+ start:5804 stop:6028 length:225 start_codon:yes stop_codon:yes gene_type:complete
MKGDLVYIPSRSEFYKTGHNQNTKWEVHNITEFIRVEKPINALLLESPSIENSYVRVLYNGEEWYIDKNDVRFV